jgi:hypothetical protein
VSPQSGISGAAVFKRLKRNSAAVRLIEEELYGMALAELESGHFRSGLWAKALAYSSGDEQKARGLYLKYRVQSIHDEAEVAEGIAEELRDEAASQSVKDQPDREKSKDLPRKAMSKDQLAMEKYKNQFR